MQKAAHLQSQQRTPLRSLCLKLDSGAQLPFSRRSNQAPRTPLLRPLQVIAEMCACVYVLVYWIMEYARIQEHCATEQQMTANGDQAADLYLVCMSLWCLNQASCARAAKGGFMEKLASIKAAAASAPVHRPKPAATFGVARGGGKGRPKGKR